MNDEAAATQGAAPASGGSAPPTEEMPPTAEKTPPSADAPPWAGGPPFSRDKLVRPKQGRYLAGVCGALARATNTDPVLWRVLLAVLAVLSGVGVLLYLIGWLIIPAEGDTASPIESLLGKGRSGMAPLSVVVLGGAAVLSFAFIVQDGMRAALLACAVIGGAILLIKRTNNGQDPAAPASTPPTMPAQDPFPTAQFPATPGFGAPDAPASGFGAADAPASGFGAPGAPASGFGPPDAPASGSSAAPAPAEPPVEPVTAPMPPFTPAPGAYRPPFAPHGPYARPGTATFPPPMPPSAQRPPKPPKKPKERSKLGRLTFFALIVVIGVMAAIDTAGASIATSAYIAAALATVAAGLIVGAWLGRARGLIALGLLLCLALLAATGAERWGDEVGNSVYRPTSVTQIADRYDFTAGNATLDLRGVDFTGQQQAIVVTMKFGQVRIILPQKVDTTAVLQVDNGRAEIFGKTFEGHEATDGQDLTDLGPDGAGGGTLKLDLRLEAGNLEVHR
jgi:phage shock protein PspC (stress-responsive transcriptional regulator)